MNTTEHLLTCLSEECCEVSHNVAKALRFGLDDRNVLDPNGPTNRERLIIELNDLLAVIHMLENRRIINPNWVNQEKQHEKINKVIKFMDYAVKVNALKNGNATDK